MVGCLVGWMVGLMVEWMVGWLDDWMVGWLVRCMSSKVGSQIMSKYEKCVMLWYHYDQLVPLDLELLSQLFSLL